MASRPLSENPYASPTSPAGEVIEAERADGVTWEDERVLIEFTPAVDDYVEAEMYRAFIDVRERRWGAVKLLAILAGVPWLCLLFSSNPPRLLSEIWLWAILFPAVVLLLFTPWRKRRTVIASVVGPWVQSDAKEYLATVRTVFTPQGLTCGTADGYRVRYWYAIDRAVVLDEHFLFVRGKTVFLILPKRVFADPAEIERFSDWIRGFVPVGPK